MQKAPPIEAFPQDVQDFIHQLIANAIQRAIKNGTYKVAKGEHKEINSGGS